MAPSHGRASQRCHDFLDVLKLKMTFFGNANSEHLANGAWNYRKLAFITNNQAGCVIVDAEQDPMDLYVTHEPFARRVNPNTFFLKSLQAYYYGPIIERITEVERLVCGGLMASKKWADNSIRSSSRSRFECLRAKRP